MKDPVLTFLINPEAVKDALLSGRRLLVEVDRACHHTVTVVDDPAPKPSAIAIAKRN